MYIDLIVWGVYFTVGIILLVVLLFGRQSLKKIAKRREEANRAVARIKPKEDTTAWTRNRRVI